MEEDKVSFLVGSVGGGGEILIGGGGNNGQLQLHKGGIGGGVMKLGGKFLTVLLS